MLNKLAINLSTLLFITAVNKGRTLMYVFVSIYKLINKIKRLMFMASDSHCSYYKYNCTICFICFFV